MPTGRVAADNSLGSDIQLAEFFLGADLGVNQRGDIEFVSEEMNLAQALLHRLRTAKGELTELGHPDYGSTILSFIGQPNNWVTRERLKLAIRDTLRQEKRIKDIVSISVGQRLGMPDTATNGPTRSEIKSATSRSMGIGRGYEEGQEDNNSTHDPDFVVESQTKTGVLSSNDMLSIVDIDIVVIPIGSTTPLQIVFPFNLEVA